MLVKDILSDANEIKIRVDDLEDWQSRTDIYSGDDSSGINHTLPMSNNESFLDSEFDSEEYNDRRRRHFLRLN